MKGKHLDHEERAYIIDQYYSEKRSASEIAKDGFGKATVIRTLRDYADDIDEFANLLGVSVADLPNAGNLLLRRLTHSWLDKAFESGFEEGTELVEHDRSVQSELLEPRFEMPPV